MAEEGDAGEKTEAPTARRKSDARQQGNIGQSKDLSDLLGMVAAFLALEYICPYIWKDLQILTVMSFKSKYNTEEINLAVVHHEFHNLVLMILPELLLITAIAAFFGAGSMALQTNFLWSRKLLKPRFSLLNPISGIKRIFSPGQLVQTLKSIAKLCIIGPIGYFAFIDWFPKLIGLMSVPIHDLLPFTSVVTADIFWSIVELLIVLAILDAIWQKWRTFEKMKMSKQEVKDEKKATEGDEATRRRIVALGLQRARERMMAAVPTADVVVTNPTHIAVALKYTMEPGAAPKVVAKGKGFIAEKIKKVARENRIPVVERKPLARALFKMAEVGEEIPYELYKAVAELLAYVYKIRGSNPFRGQAQQNSSGGE